MTLDIIHHKNKGKRHTSNRNKKLKTDMQYGRRRSSRKARRNWEMLGMFLEDEYSDTGS